MTTSLARDLCLGALAVVLLLTSACSNPKCWTHDSWEVEGGCHVFSGSPRSRPEAESEAEARKTEHALLATNKTRCTAGDPRACGVVADIEESMNVPAKEIEARYTTACVGDQRARNTWCRKAGEYAMRPGGDGTAAAIERFTLGCALHDDSPARGLHAWIARMRPPT